MRKKIKENSSKTMKNLKIDCPNLCLSETIFSSFFPNFLTKFPITLTCIESDNVKLILLVTLSTLAFICLWIQSGSFFHVIRE